MFKNMVEWSKLTLAQRYNFLLAAVAVGLCVVIRTYQLREVKLEAKIENIENDRNKDRDNYIDRLQKFEDENRELLMRFYNIRNDVFNFKKEVKNEK